MGAVWAVATVFRPVIWLLSKSTNGVLRLLHIDPKADEEEVSEDEIRMMVDLGEERGTIEANEKELIDNIFEFNNTTAEDVMVHRTDMVMIWADDPRTKSCVRFKIQGCHAFRCARRMPMILSVCSIPGIICLTPSWPTLSLCGNC